MNYIQDIDGHDLEQSAWCSMPFNKDYLDKTPLYFTIASTVLYFLVPFTIVFVLYTRLDNSTFLLKHIISFLCQDWAGNET